MKLQNKIPELERYFVSGDKTVYYLQKIIKYDEGHNETYIIGVWDSPEGDIDKAAQNIVRQEKEFCEHNKFVKQHTMTIRKIKAVISLKVVESRSEHYCNDFKFKSFKCENCGGNINYGDEVVIKKYDTCDKYFCCNNCLAEYEDADYLSPGEIDYDDLFLIK